MIKTTRRPWAREITAVVLAACFGASACAAPPSSGGGGQGETTTDQWAAAKWSVAKAGQPLDPAFYSTTPTLDDSFSTPGCPEIGNYSVDQPNPGYKWYVIASTMGVGVNGVIHRHDGSADDPYDCASGHLKIKLFYSQSEGKWVGGSIQSNDWSGDGQTFTYGYYEVAASLPPTWSPSLQPWVAIWLNGRTSTRANSTYQELDVLETITRDSQTAVSVTTHEWPGNTPLPGQLAAHRRNGYTANENLWDGQVHRYGVLRSPDEECVVFDRKIQQCQPIVADDMRGPMSILIDANLAFAPTDTTKTSEMDVMRASFYPCPQSRPRCS